MNCNHPASEIEYDQLLTDLSYEVESGNVSEQLGDYGLRLYCYTQQCSYDKKWNATNLLARGLILDTFGKKVVAYSFPKFFNLGEHGIERIPNSKFEIFEKLDGSLIILFYHNGHWRTATKGSFKSDQAKWASAWLLQFNLQKLDKDLTILFEAIYPENRIVVPYSADRIGLYVLGAYSNKGVEFPYEYIRWLADEMGFKFCKRYKYASVSELVEKAKKLPANEEGFVLRFANGLRLKIKGDEYCRIHKLVSRLTPIAVWEAMYNKRDMEELRKQLPEEFLVDFDKIVHILSVQILDLCSEAQKIADETADLSNKDLGLALHTYDDSIRKFIFPARREVNFPEKRTIEAMYMQIRPTGNKLEGYTPSNAMHRVREEDA